MVRYFSTENLVLDFFHPLDRCTCTPFSYGSSPLSSVLPGFPSRTDFTNFLSSGRHTDLVLYRPLHQSLFSFCLVHSNHPRIYNRRSGFSGLDTVVRLHTFYKSCYFLLENQICDYSLNIKVIYCIRLIYYSPSPSYI